MDVRSEGKNTKMSRLCEIPAMPRETRETQAVGHALGTGTKLRPLSPLCRLGDLVKDPT